jgi:hypothetical protein
VQVEHVAPQIIRGGERSLVEQQPNGFVLVQFKQTSLRVLDGVEDSVQCLFRAASMNLVVVFVMVFNPFITASGYLRMCSRSRSLPAKYFACDKRIENGLDDGRLRAEILFDQTETG